MTSELERFRDHAHAMATMTKPVMEKVWCHDLGNGLPGWRMEVLTEVPTPADRALWAQLASEVDAYLAGRDKQLAFAEVDDTRKVPPCTGEPGCTADDHMLCCRALLENQEDL